MFLIFTATWLAYCGSRQDNVSHPRVAVEDFMLMPRWFPSPSSLAFRRHEAVWLAAVTQSNASGVADSERYWRIEQRCRFLVARSCPEVEPRVFPLLDGIYRKPVVPAGLLLPEDGRPDGGDDHEDARSSGVLQWLDEQPPRSVLYVALGSEAPVTAENVHELAAGLELSGARFLWAFRPPSGGGATAGTGAPAPPLLPDGFEARARGRGAVCTGWVPQVKVLAHAAVGAFLTHCGWGSVTESLLFGHPLVMLPFITDQGLIARIMAERGVGVEVARRDDGAFGRDDVAEAVRRVMVEEEGKTLALNARRLRQSVVGDDGGRQERYVDELVECFRRHSFN
ncbi:UDP-glycosyltransferase 91C1 [Dichanthelium oligosanthes]|uniref:UDP-glycosyltransferase 91C1 n=1 Tax=Dichanthelium oligosanthes TaxID=888268 RepID=A0A1E5VKQ7_9POAL|nr:UDP-glycosyltransferase 91C1 [Dichanthelium oligosanthes]